MPLSVKLENYFSPPESKSIVCQYSKCAELGRTFRSRYVWTRLFYQEPQIQGKYYSLKGSQIVS